MSSTPMYDPLSTEARSPWLAGLTEACYKISSILDLGTDSFVDLTLPPVDDNYLIYQAPLGNKLWLDNPAPVIRKNGIVITPFNDNFTINYLGGSVEFDRGYALTKSDVITADATFIVDDSNVIDKLLSDVNRLSLTAGQYKGYFQDYDSMIATLGNGISGNYAIVGGTDNMLYLWNSTSKTWEPSAPKVDLSGYYTKGETDDLLDELSSEKEDVIVAQGTTASSDDYYYGGRKTWVKLSDKVKNVTLTDLDTSDPSKITSNDSVIDGIGKLQAQIDEYTHDLFGTSAPTTATVGKIGQDYTNTSTGDKYHLVEINGTNYIWEQYQDKLEFDSTPTAGSTNLVTSGALYQQFTNINNDFTDDLSQKADKVVPSSAGNIATLDANGNLVDSGKGVNDVGKSPIIQEITLPASGWSSGAPSTKTVTVNGVLADTTKQSIMVSPTPDANFTNIDAIATYSIMCTGQGANTLTFTASKGAPTVAVKFNLSIQNL